MIIFQTVSSSDATSLPFERLLDPGRSAFATTFRNNAYIHRLNRTLQSEMRALSAYHSMLTKHPGCEPAHDGCTSHQRAGKELVRLIIANRGIPEDKAALSLGLTKTFIQICASIPVRLFERASISTLRSLEKQLITSYEKLRSQAPARDREAIDGLLLRTREQHEATLKWREIPHP